MIDAVARMNIKGGMRRMAKTNRPSAKVRKFTVIAKALIGLEGLHPEDRDENIPGNYHYEVENEDAALDEFHETVPVKVLDDFEFTVVKGHV